VESPKGSQGPEGEPRKVRNWVALCHGGGGIKTKGQKRSFQGVKRVGEGLPKHGDDLEGVTRWGPARKAERLRHTAEKKEEVRPVPGGRSSKTRKGEHTEKVPQKVGHHVQGMVVVCTTVGEAKKGPKEKTRR